MTYRARCNGRKHRFGRRKFRLGKKWYVVLGNVKLRDRKADEFGKTFREAQARVLEKYADTFRKLADYESELPKTETETNNECTCPPPPVQKWENVCEYCKGYP